MAEQVNRAYRVEEVTASHGGTLDLGTDDQAFYLGVQRCGQYPDRYTFVVLRKVEDDA